MPHEVANVLIIMEREVSNGVIDFVGGMDSRVVRMGALNEIATVFSAVGGFHDQADDPCGTKTTDLEFTVISVCKCLVRGHPQQAGQRIATQKVKGD
jgi:hypothetical protein